MKKIICLLVFVLSLTACDTFRNHYIKYYPIFPTQQQYQDCFGKEYAASFEKCTEEAFNETYGAYKYVGNVYYWYSDTEIKDYDGTLIYAIDLDMADSVNQLGKFEKNWIGEFDDTYLLEKNNHYALYYCGPNEDYETNITCDDLNMYGKFYFENFEV